jgi:glycosyltransferase involved in cell wall biosynthesis
MNPNGSVMIVANIFPPVAEVGVYRTVALSRQLANAGWSVAVLTAAPRDDAFVDEAILSKVPASVRVIRAASPNLPLIAARIVKGKGRSSGGAAPVSEEPSAGGVPRKRGLAKTTVDWMSWWMHVPDTLTGWLIPAVRAGLREARRERPRVIYSTAPAWTSHLVGLMLSRLLRLPFVADFQDPWCGSFWRKIPYRSQRWIDEQLERMVVRRAFRITCCWDGIRRCLDTRYPKRSADICTILNGYWPDETEEVEPVRLDDRRCVLLHAGAFYGPRSPKPLLCALQQLRAESPVDAESLLIALVGRTEYAGRPIEEMVREHGVEDLVRIIPPVARREALALTKGASVALLFGQSGYEELASVPAKTFDYVGIGLPVLAIGGGDEVCGIIRDGGCRLWRVHEDDSQGILTALREISEAHRRQSLAPSRDDRRLAFAWPAAAAKLADVLSVAMNMNLSDGCHGS